MKGRGRREEEKRGRGAVGEGRIRRGREGRGNGGRGTRRGVRERDPGMVTSRVSTCVGR